MSTSISGPLPPTFKNDHDALVFLIGHYGFKGGCIGAGGMFALLLISKECYEWL